MLYKSEIVFIALMLTLQVAALWMALLASDAVGIVKSAVLIWVWFFLAEFTKENRLTKI